MKDLTQYSLIVFIFLLTSNITTQAQDSSKVWYTPNLGSVDMLDLFSQPQQWDSARAKVDVFKFYTTQVGTAGWSCLSNTASNCGQNHIQNLINAQAFSKLGQWGIDIAVESFFAGPIMSTNPTVCSTNQHISSLTLDGSINVIQSIESNGGTVRYLAMDEPIRQWYAEYYYLYTGQTDPRPCLVDSLGALADHVAAYIQQMDTWFPAVSIGHIELYPEVGVPQLKEWVLALEARGVSLSFLHLDIHSNRVDYYASLGINIDVAADMLELKAFLKLHNIDFGLIIFDAYWDKKYWNPGEYTDSIYYDGAMNFVNFIKNENLKPDHNIFQSWVHPYYTTGIGPNQTPINLPENDSSIYSHTRLLIDGCKVLSSAPLGINSPLTINDFTLHQNYPNPFNTETTIPYSLKTPTQVVIKIYNILGIHVNTLINEQKTAGKYRITWDGKNAQEAKVPNGIYMYSMTANGQTLIKRLVLLAE